MLRSARFVTLVTVCLLVGSLPARAQNVNATWGANGNSAWLTGANWAGGSYAGLFGAAGSNLNIATFTNAFTATTVGINMNNPGNGLNLGAISLESTRITALNIGNSSSAQAGDLRLYGATVNSVANTVLANAGTGLLTIQASQSGGGSMGLILSNAANTNVVNITGTGGITISSNISGTGQTLVKQGAGTGVLTLSGNNTYSGGTTLAGGAISIASAANLGTGNFNVTGIATTLSITGTAVTFANTVNFNLPSLTGRFAFVTPNSSNTTINGTISGGNASTSNTSATGTEWFFQGGTSGQNTGVLTLNGINTNWRGTLNVQRGPVVLGNANALGSVLLFLDSNNNPNGALQFANSFTIANNVYFNSGANQNIGVGGSLTAGISGNLASGTNFGFAKVGTGTLVLSGTNTYSGTTLVNAGTLQIGAGGTTGTLGSGATTIGTGTTLAFNRSNAYSYAGGTTVTGTLSQTGTGTTTLSGVVSGAGPITVSAGVLNLANAANTRTGTTTVTGGTFRMAVGAGIGDVSATSGTFAVDYGTAASTQTVNSLTVNNGALTFQFNQTTLPVAPLLTSTGAITPTGTNVINVQNTAGSLPVGTMTLLGYTGPQITSGFSLGTLPTPRTVADLDYSTPGQVNLNITGIDSIRWFGDLSSDWDVGSAVNVGGTNNFRSINLGTPTNFVSGDAVLFNDAASGSGPIAVNLPADVQPSIVTVDNSARDITFSGPGKITGGTSLTKTGTGTLTLANPNDFTAGVTLSAGTLQIGNGGITGSITANIATSAGTSLVFNRSDNLTYAGSLTGAALLTQAGSGTLTLTGSNALTAGTVVTGGGTLVVASDALLGTAPGTPTPGNIVLNNGTLNTTGSFTLNPNRGIAVGPASGTGGGTIAVGTGTVLTLSSVIANNQAGTGSLTKTGAGLLSLNGTNTYSGGFNLVGGPLLIVTGSEFGSGTFTMGNGAIAGPAGSPAGAALGVNNNAAVTIPNAIILPTPGSATTYSVVKSTASAAGGTVLDFTGPISGGNANVTWYFNSNTSGDSTTAFQFSGNNTFTVGTLNLNRGRFIVNNINGLGASTNVVRLDSNANSTFGNLSFNVSGTFANPITITAASPYPLGVTAGNTVTLTSPVTAANTVRKVDAGILVFGANSVFTTGVSIEGGTLIVNSVADAGLTPTVTTTTNSATATVSNAAGLAVGQTIVAATIPAGTTITAISGNTLTLSSGTGVTAGTNTASTIGTPSPLGMAAAAAANLVVNNATLRYTGSTASTNRGFTIGLAGGTLDSSGSGPIGFTNPGVVGLAGTNAARTLTLTGSNAGANTIAGILGDNGTGATSLGKTGVGTWVLAGINTYTGSTNVDAGTLTLAVSGALPGASPVNLNGGTLSVAAGTTNGSPTGGVLTLGTGTSILDFGNAGSATVLSFGDSSGATWTGTLTINGYTGPGAATASTTTQLFIGNSATLSPSQLAAITFSGFELSGQAVQLPTGEVVPAGVVPEPVMLLGLGACFAGLMGLRRRRKD